MFYCRKINPTTFTGAPTAHQTGARCPIYTRTGRVTSAAAYAVLALKKLTNRWEGDADVPPREWETLGYW